MSGRISYEVLVTDPEGVTETTRYHSKDDARLEVERIRRFHPGSAARMEVLEEEASPTEPPASSPRDFECPNCKAPAGSPCRRPSGHVVPFGDFHADRKRLISAR